MKHIWPLDKRAELRSVGGKAFNLSLLAGSGLKVPRGFVIGAAAFGETLGAELKQLRETRGAEAVKALLPLLKEKARRAAFSPALGQEISEAFALLNAPVAAVRSSAEAEDGAGGSFAGQFESFLGVNAGGLDSAIKRCWASAFSRRAHSYREGFIPGMAVIVQEMVEAEVSGVAFSCDPVSGDRSSVVIEAVYGLCEPLVSGSVTPDNYRVSKEGVAAGGKNIVPQREYLGVSPAGGTALFPVPEGLRAQAKLGEEMLHRIARAAVSVESLFGKPVDIEWALKGGELHILQARPVTGLEEGK
ncbi:MAG: PEP/pyruvate-binding domain-containing protein [Elusimicrobiota bacterium]|nr:PEP/pyruvate-binding domain-containing protein [Elusimicrobiota bacterium]